MSIFSNAKAANATKSPQLSILGEPLSIISLGPRSIVARTPTRLCPGRRIAMRVDGAGMTTVTIDTSVVCALGAEGPVYEVELTSERAFTFAPVAAANLEVADKRAIA